jgi:hypothetical protein
MQEPASPAAGRQPLPPWELAGARPLREPREGGRYYLAALEKWGRRDFVRKWRAGKEAVETGPARCAARPSGARAGIPQMPLRSGARCAGSRRCCAPAGSSSWPTRIATKSAPAALCCAAAPKPCVTSCGRGSWAGAAAPAISRRTKRAFSRPLASPLPLCIFVNPHAVRRLPNRGRRRRGGGFRSPWRSPRSSAPCAELLSCSEL